MTPNSKRRISAYLQGMMMGRPEGALFPGFAALFDTQSAEPYRNYATPLAGADPDARDVANLIAQFEQRRRMPRLEFLPETAPGLRKALQGAGFIEEGQLPLMVHSPEPRRDGMRLPVDLALAKSAAALADAAQVQNDAFDAGPIAQADVDRLVRLTERGGFVGLARLRTGEPVASGVVTHPMNGVAELAALGVDRNHRRRGYGRMMADFLAATAKGRGVDLLFLMAAGEEEARMYRSIGFVETGEILHVSRPSPP